MSLGMYAFNMAIWECVWTVLQFMDSYYITDILSVQRIHYQQISNSLWQLSFLVCFHSFSHRKFEPPHDKTNKMACAPNEDSDQPGHPPSLIRVFAIRMKKAWVLSYLFNAQRRLQTGRLPRLTWVFAGRTYHFVGFVVRRLICEKDTENDSHLNATSCNHSLWF